MNQTSAPSSIDVETYRIVVVGSGFSGIGLAIKLKEQGENSFLVIERESALGGSWRDNTYPGAQCDIQSHLYSYSFMPNPNWSRVYAPQGEILDYMHDCVKKGRVENHLRFNTELLSADWDSDRNVWKILTTTGYLESDILVAASGHLSDPKYPDIQGIDEFTGVKFHSSRWDHSVDLATKKVGVLGTGASAIQIIPQVAELASELTVFQRSAPYVIPRMDREYTEAEKKMFARLPEMMQELRSELFWANEARFPQRRNIKSFISKVKKLALDHLANQIPDPELRAKLTPDYELGCKRLLISNNYYPTFLRDSVVLETNGIDSIDGNSVVTMDGSRHELDVLIVSTGFEASDLPVSYLIKGSNGVLLSDHWANGGQAYACSTVNGFPNLFIMNGPNSGLGAGSIIFIIECQINYILGALAEMKERNASKIEVSLQAENDFAQMVADKAEGTVWLSGGCKSWYVDQRNGKLTTIWPDFMTHFRQINGEFSPEAYVFDSAESPELANA